MDDNGSKQCVIHESDNFQQMHKWSPAGRIPFKLESEINLISGLMIKYKNIPMSLADSSLVKMSKQIANSVICTLVSNFFG